MTNGPPGPGWRGVIVDAHSMERSHGPDQCLVGTGGHGVDGPGADSGHRLTNWLLIPFAAVGAIIAAIGILFTSSARTGRAKAGLLLNGIVIVVAIVRLGIGGGIF